MVNANQIEKGVAAYLDEEVMPQVHLEPWKKAVLGTGASVAIKRVGNVLENIKGNQALSALGVVDQEGNVDIDIVSTEFKKQIPTEGLKVKIPLLGEITFHESDVDMLYRKITGA